MTQLTLTSELQLHEIVEQEHGYSVMYYLVNDFGTASVKKRILKKDLKQFVIDGGFNVDNGEDQFTLDADTYLSENYREVITNYIEEGN